MYTIGPHRFTEHDARRTVAAYSSIWTQLADGRDTTAIERLRVAPSGAPDRLDDDLHLVWSSLVAAGPALRAAGQLPATRTGTVVQLSRSDGGVPKAAVADVEVGWRGVVGDRQAARAHHGRPWQALCLWSQEVIATLNDAGHRLHPGATGENVTIGGLDWADVRPGVRLRVGSVLCEASAFAEPCSKNARWFAGRDIGAMHESAGPVSRIYATVLEPGRIATGDQVVLEP